MLMPSATSCVNRAYALSEIGKPMVEQTGVLRAYGHVFRLSRRGLRQELLQFLERVAHVLGVPFRRLLHPGIGQTLLKAA